MPRVYTELEVVRAICYATMSAWSFDYNRKRNWVIWAARHRRCSTCLSAPHQPCVNMADRKQNRPERINKQPHEDRIDWVKLLEGLKQRDLYRPQVETQVRRSIPTEEVDLDD